MKTGIFDLETSGLYANFGIVLCCVVKPFGHGKPSIIRADQFSTWKTKRSDDSLITARILNELKEYDILVAHNGQYFDKQWLNTLSLKHHAGAPIRFKKFIDPVLLSRKHLRLGRNSLDQLIDYFEIQDKKTHIDGKFWKKAVLDGDRQSMDYICHHCVQDVKSLEKVYDIVRSLVENINNRGSAN